MAKMSKEIIIKNWIEKHCFTARKKVFANNTVFLQRLAEIDTGCDVGVFEFEQIAKGMGFAVNTIALKTRRNKRHWSKV